MIGFCWLEVMLSEVLRLEQGLGAIENCTRRRLHRLDHRGRHLRKCCRPVAQAYRRDVGRKRIMSDIRGQGNFETLKPEPHPDSRFHFRQRVGVNETEAPV